MLKNATYIDQSTIPEAGLGVFSKDDQEEGALIEECVVFPFPNALDIPTFWDHQLEWTDDHDALATGHALLYNHHSQTPNVRFERDFENKRIRIYTRRPLKAKEELFCNYCCKPWW